MPNLAIRSLRCIAFLLATAVLTSCGTTQMGWSHAGLRQIMMAYTENEIMDNLIRAKKGYPLMHFDVDSVTAEVTSELKVEAGVGETLTNKAALLANEVIRPKTVNPSLDRTGHLTLSMKPVLNANEVYTAYVTFARLDGALVQNNHPDPKSVHMGRWFTCPNGRREFWYVPEEPKFVEPFLWLCLRTSVYRGETAKNPLEALSPPSASESGTTTKAKPHVPQELIGPPVTPNLLKLQRGDTLEDVVRELRNLRRR